MISNFSVEHTLNEISLPENLSQWSAVFVWLYSLRVFTYQKTSLLFHVLLVLWPSNVRAKTSVYKFPTLNKPKFLFKVCVYWLTFHLYLPFTISHLNAFKLYSPVNHFWLIHYVSFNYVLILRMISGVSFLKTFKWF